MDDELQEIRDNFYVGNFAKVSALCESLTASDDIAQNECDAIKGRCCLSLGAMEKLKAMQNSECPGQRAAACMIVLMKSKKPEQAAQAKDRLKALAEDTQDASAAALAANAFAMEGSWADAVAMTQAHPVLEMQALRVYILLMCNQPAMAEKQLQEMTGTNDDSAVFRMAQAAVHLATGNPEEAYLTYCDLSSQFPSVEGDDESGGSVLLQTGKAVANMQRGMFNEAVEDLNRALPNAPNDPDLLVNLCCCATHLGKKDEFQQHYAKLEQVAPTHPYVVKTQSIKTVFQRFRASLTA